jgi:Spy/CpxP family protein refolding chaperone
MGARFLITSIFSLAMFSSMLAQSPDADSPPDASRKIHHDFQQTLKQLNLTDAQGQQVREIMQSSQLDFRAVLRNYLAAKKELEDAIRANPDDEDTIRARSAQLGSAMTEITVKRAQLRSQITKVLTPEQQQQQWNQFQQKQEDRLQERINRLNQPADT